MTADSPWASAMALGILGLTFACGYYTAWARARKARARDH
jgi:hypothetical protein